MKSVDIRELDMYCPICGSPQFEIVEMEYESRKYDLYATITFECDGCRTTIKKEFRNPSIPVDDPYGFFTEEVKAHLYRRFAGKV